MKAAHLRPLVRDSQLRAQLAVYVCARLPSGMMVLSLLLHVHARLSDLAGTGVVVAVYGAGVAVGAPVVGRMVDRFGPRPILRAAALTHVVGAATLLAGSSAAVLCVGAAVAGAGLPPTAPCMRASWRALPEATRAAVFAVDGIVLELAGVIGPLVVSLLAVLWLPAVGVGAAAGCSAAAACAAALMVPAERCRSRTQRHWLGPLRSPTVTLLLASVALVTAAIAVLEVSAVGFAAEHHHPALAGPLFALMAAGSVTGGVLFAVRGLHTSAPAVLPRLCLLSAAGFLLLPLADQHVGLLAALFAVSNGAIAPLFAALFSSLGDAAPDGQAAETFTWVSSSNFVGISAGTALGGVLLARVGSTAAYVVAAGLLVLAALCAAAARRARTEDAVPQPVDSRS